MNNSTDKPGESHLPNQFFDDSTFKTLYGGVTVTWVATSAIAYAWGPLDPKILGFWVALAVAFAGYGVSKNRSLKKLIVTPFNGLLIYLTIMGGTSFLPPPGAAQADLGTDSAAVADTTRTSPGDAREVEPASGFFTSWTVDRQMLSRTATLQQQNRELMDRTRQLRQSNIEYKARLDSTREILQTVQLPAGVRNKLMQNLNVELINTDQLNNPNF